MKTRKDRGIPGPFSFQVEAMDAVNWRLQGG